MAKERKAAAEAIKARTKRKDEELERDDTNGNKHLKTTFRGIGASEHHDLVLPLERMVDLSGTLGEAIAVMKPLLASMELTRVAIEGLASRYDRENIEQYAGGAAEMTAESEPRHRSGRRPRSSATPMDTEYGTREEAGLGPLIVEDDVFDGYKYKYSGTGKKKIQLEPSIKVRKLRFMATGHSSRLKRIETKLIETKLLGNGGVPLRDEDGDRAKICVARKDGNEVLLAVRKSGGAPGSSDYIPEFSCNGKVEKTENPAIQFFHPELELSYWTENEAYKEIGIQNKKACIAAWKRWLVRVWAHMLPRSKINIIKSHRSEGDIAQGKASAKKGRAKAKRRKATQATQASGSKLDDQNDDEGEDEDDEGSIDPLYEGVGPDDMDQLRALVAKFGIKAVEQYWTVFNKRPNLFNLEDAILEERVITGWIHAKFPKDQYQGRHTGPDSKMLQDAKKVAIQLKCEVEKTIVYMNWANREASGTKGEVETIIIPSLDERKLAERASRTANAPTPSRPAAATRKPVGIIKNKNKNKKPIRFTKEEIKFLLSMDKNAYPKQHLGAW